MIKITQDNGHPEEEDSVTGPQGFRLPFFQLGHRSSVPTPFSAEAICNPHPAHVDFPQLAQFTR